MLPHSLQELGSFVEYCSYEEDRREALPGCGRIVGLRVLKEGQLEKAQRVKCPTKCHDLHKGLFTAN